MAVTVALNPNQSIDDAPKQYFGLSTDTKPTIDSPGHLPPPSIGSTFTETDTGIFYSTYDQTNWIEGIDASRQWALVLDKLESSRQLQEDLLEEVRKIKWGFADYINKDLDKEYV